MSRTRRMLGGLGVGYANQLIVMLVGLWLTAFLLTRLGAEEYGLWLITTQILAYLLLADLGVVGILPRETAFAVGRAGGPADAADLPALVGTTLRVVLLQLPLLALAAAGLWLLLPAAWAPLRGPLLVVLAVFVAAFPLRILHAVLHGLQELAFLGTVQLWSWALTTALTVGLVLAGYGLYALAVGWAAGQALNGVLWWRRLRRRYPAVWPATLPHLGIRGAARRVGRGAWISVSQVAQALLQGTDLLVIGKVLGPAAVVPYFCTAKLVTVLANQPQMIAQTAGPGLSELRTGAPPAHLARVLEALLRVMLIVSGAIVCVILAANDGFVTWWVGAERYGGFALTAVLVGGMLLRQVNTAAAYALFAFGRDRRLALTTVADGLVTVAVSIVLVREYGIIGAAIGSLVGVALVSLPGNLPLMLRDVAIGAGRFLRGLWPWAWRFAAAAAVALWIERSWVPDTVPTLLVTGVIVGGIYTALTGPLAFRPPLDTYVRPLWQRLTRRAGPEDVPA